MKTFSFSDAYSHPGRRLTDHLLEVAREAARTMDAWRNVDLPSEFRQVALLACLCHDTGKATPWFQRRLRDGRKGRLTPHAAISAAITRGVLERAGGGRTGTGDLLEAMAVVAVRRHHGALVDILEGEYSAGMLAASARRAEEDPDAPLAKQWAVFDWEGFGTWLRSVLPAFGVEPFVLGDKPPSVADLFPARNWRRKLRKLKRECTVADAVAAQLLFSLVVGSDKLDAALYGKIPEISSKVPVDAVARYRAVRFSGRPPTPADRLRNAVWQDVSETLSAHPGERLFTLTAPTGAGKTLTALEVALRMATLEAAEAGGAADEVADGEPRGTHGQFQSRIIYCLPFTSIVDQNFDVIRDVLEHAGVPTDSRVLVKHHHLADVSWHKEDGEEYDPDRALLLVESWKSRVVVTTFVQLVEALLGNRNRMLKKVMQVPGAVVLLDEVQAIPRRLWEVVREALLAWARVAGTRFVLLTATRPLILRDGDALELCREKSAHFSQLDRVTLTPRIDMPFGLEAFAEDLATTVLGAPDRSRLVIANTIASARDLYTLLKKRGMEDVVTLVYLSTHLTPRDRLRRIARIRENRNGRRPWLVVSTQLVEAGVDISMDEVYRDLAPLDAIIQAAGRCNRSAERGQGRVTVLRLVDERGAAYCKQVYDPILLEVTERLLAEQKTFDEQSFLMLGETYFERMWRATTGAEHFVEAFGTLDFDTLGGVRLIAYPGKVQPYFVLARDDPQAAELWDTYQAIREEGGDREAFSRIKRAFLERIINVRVRNPIEDEILPLYPDGEEYYDEEVGYRHGDQSIQFC